MPNSPLTPGVVPGRLPAEAYAANFADHEAPFDRHEAQVAADRCYFCHDAPCMQACPTAIDIPLFIRQIATGNPLGSAKTIFDQNIMGGMCARVCPTETLCEEACVRETAEGKPVLLDYYADWCTDCVRMEATTFKDPRVRAALKNFELAQADVTENNDDARAIKKKYGVLGPPAMLVFAANGEERKDLRFYGYKNVEELLALLAGI